MSRLILFNKPYNVLSQFTDRSVAADRGTLSDFIDLPGVYPAGRLDLDSEGLLLLTDDGRLQARIADPKFKMPKTYLVQVEGDPDASLASLRQGIQLKDGMTLPAEVERIADPELWPRDPPVRLAQADHPRGSQPASAQDDGCGGHPDTQAGAVEYRRMDPWRNAARRMATDRGLTSPRRNSRCPGRPER
jgi:pseudouridine synthase